MPKKTEDLDPRAVAVVDAAIAEIESDRDRQAFLFFLIAAAAAKVMSLQKP
ncbi:MAG: hypothetical protein HC771_22740 [Synechococcales cyanobacterium CRU_2_2]|nr:hypothetical protein [Synechococcales cyanobacterium CRU_2_2]